VEYVVKKLSRKFLRFRIAKLGLGKESGGTHSSWTVKLGYTRISKIGRFFRGIIETKILSGVVYSTDFFPGKIFYILTTERVRKQKRKKRYDERMKQGKRETG
jgi:CTP:phosphocholine cytidylyltransferase-like protein